MMVDNMQRDIAEWKKKHTDALVAHTNNLQRMIGRTEQKQRLDAALQPSSTAAQVTDKVSFYFTFEKKVSNVY